MVRLLVVIWALAFATGCDLGSAPRGGTGAAETRAESNVQGRAPLSIPSSQVKIVGGSHRQSIALRHILRGFGWTAIRAIHIQPPPPGVRGQGTSFSYVIAQPEQAAHLGILSFQGQWEAAMVGESYAAISGAQRLPALRWQTVSDLLPDGSIVGRSGYADTDYGGHLEELPSRAAITKAVREASNRADFEVLYVGFVRPYRALPVIIVSVNDPKQLRKRLDGFLRRVLPSPQINLAYVQLDTPCGRPVFARGQGVAIDPHWFNICDFSVGCPLWTGGSKPTARPTYPC